MKKMKIKITFIVGQCRKDLPVNHPKYFQVYLTDEHEFPYSYMSTKDEYDTLKDISDKHFQVNFDWLPKELAGFRRLSQNEVEVTYMAHMPEVSGIHKTGDFVSEEVIEAFNIELDPYYEELLSRRSRAF
tara:strand:- start:803 stop:1192 length:390 start_codon:yes stop_codon:yes gene_type:complete